MRNFGVVPRQGHTVPRLLSPFGVWVMLAVICALAGALWGLLA